MNGKNWLKKFEIEEKPVCIKEYLLDLSKICFREISRRNSSVKKKTMEEILEITKYAVRDFYSNSLDVKITKKEVKNFLRKNKFKDYHIKESHLFGEEEEVLSFYQFIKNHNYSFDVVIPVMNGGLEPALFVETKNLIPIRYSHLKLEDKKTFIPKCYLSDLEKKIKDKNVLITEDFIVSGRSIYHVRDLVGIYNPSKMYLSRIFDESGEKKFKKKFWREI
jgi:uracil phosphoribosyltransferase